MSKTQTKVLDTIKAIAARHGLDADVEYSYSNVGHVFFRAGLDTKANLSFDFQASSCSFAWSSGARTAYYFGHNEGLAHLQNAESFTTFLASVEALLKRAVGVL